MARKTSNTKAKLAYVSSRPQMSCLRRILSTWSRMPLRSPSSGRRGPSKSYPRTVAEARRLASLSMA